MAAELKSRLAKMMDQMADQADVVIATIHGITNKELRTHFKPNLVLCDEGQHMNIAMANVLFANFPYVPAIFSGDNKQLTSVKYGTKGNSAACYLNDDIVSREIRRGRPFLQLRTTYRSHPAIFDMLNELFYHGEALCGLKASDRPQANKFMKVCKDMGFNVKVPILFLNVADTTSTRVGYTQSSRNPKEAYASNLIERKLLEGGISGKMVTTLTGYIAHLKHSAKQRANMPRMDTTELDQELASIAHTTIAKYQGEENEIIIINNVRDGKLGFMAQRPVLYTALSRAKSGIIFIANDSSIADDNISASSRRTPTAYALLGIIARKLAFTIERFS
ncbi:MAG: hypothetical protein M1819_002305 [Sarea resinae]|nr:MAG: hypothetical protein M1819_002305 [Sarea resinae]